MAELEIVAFGIDGKSVLLKEVKSYRLSRDYDAPCDGLRVYFLSDTSLAELNAVKVYNDKKMIFNGFVDTQREEVCEDGVWCFIFARSTASVLVDNQALPFAYNCPSANSLFYHNAYSFGFDSKLPELVTSSNYQVNKGVSCYGAINDFVYGISGKNVLIDVNNCLYIPDSEDEFDLNKYNIIEEKHNINRGNVVSQIDYKINGSSEYCYHLKSRFFEEKGIKRIKKTNISSLPLWQQESALRNILESYASGYETVEISVQGFVDAPIGINAVYNGKSLTLNGDYYISSVCVCADDKGIYSRIILSKHIDLKEVNYVA